MNQELKKLFGIQIPLIPLKETGHIYAANANRVDWNEVCPNNGSDEIYLIGNPPYKGSSNQDDNQKEDFGYIFNSKNYPKKLDYVSLWFIKGSRYIENSKASLSFVSTNSITQGEQVALLYPFILETGLEIGYAYTSFKWENSAKHNAGVTVVVISLRNKSTRPKFIFTNNARIEAKNINAYLADAPNVIVKRRSKPLSMDLLPMLFGSKPTYGDHLILTPDQKDEFISNDARSKKFIKNYMGAKDYIEDNLRYCLWIEDKDADWAKSFPQVAIRLRLVRDARTKSKKKATKNLAAIPHRFGEIRYKPTDSIIVPGVSSERREYIPMGYLGPDTVISNAAFAVYDAEPWIFGLLTSRMHMVWARAVGGKMETRYRYSNTIVYNNFPVRELTGTEKEELAQLALRVLDVREYHCEKTLAQLYDPDLMPDNLRAAHWEVDRCVDKLYSERPYETDEDRLSDLFAMYEQMITAEEAAKAEKKARKATRTSSRKKV